MSYRILIVEDNPPCAEVMTLMCHLEGHEVTVASQGQIALDLLGRESFDLILMDVCLPVLDGIETTRHLRQRPETAGLPVVFITANSFADLSELHALSPVGILTKPFARQHLLASINLALK